ncbi:White collar-2 protein [Neofusicoccum parvum]|uniref:White collar-2 protein n=1 Tax=Neofusicoccum parvum TaxID=310453 RepID=A0ACB5SA94_9PEZI|nr:White collar-2 protein [Neofusicoccum parvum]
MAASDTPPFDDSPTTPTATADSAIAFLRDPDSLVPTDDILLSSLPELHFILSPSTTILRVSTNCLAVLGCEPNLLLGQRLAALVHEDDARVFSTEINEALHPHAALPFRFYCRIRSVVHVDRDYSAFEFVGHYQRFEVTQQPSKTEGGTVSDQF